MRRFLLAAALLAFFAVPAAAVPLGLWEGSSADLPGEAVDAPGGVDPGLDRFASERAAADLPGGEVDAPGRFGLVGHDPLKHRGMNAALAVYGDYAYVGSRTDGSHVNAGVMVVDVSDPSSPEVVHEIGLPNQANLGESSRELRILPEQGLLVVLNHPCSELIHRCASPSQTGRSQYRSNYRFYDIRGEHAAKPKLVSEYLPSRNAPQQPHEFFVWSDPQRPGRTLFFQTTPTTDARPEPGLIVADVSNARDGEFKEIATFKATIGNPERDNRLHSLTVSSDGRRAYLAYLGGGFLVADTSQVADAVADPQIKLVTPVDQRVFWTDPGAHSAVKVPGRDAVLVTDEVYGKLGGLLPAHGCPWGWVRMVDISDQTRPRVASEYRLPSNQPGACEGLEPDRDQVGSFSAHNPTLTKNVAFVTWHGAGLQAIDLRDPLKPRPAASFVPEPLDLVQTEDPALSQGRDKVVMWSFPIIKDGLIYAIDVRNGLYILRYRGPHRREVRRVEFLDGNSNHGDATRLDPPSSP